MPAHRSGCTIVRTARMMHPLARRTALALVSLGIASTAPAATASIFGTWHIVEAAPAPWVRPENQAALAAIGKRLINTQVVFAKGSVKSKFKPFDCKSKVLYETN